MDDDFEELHCEDTLLYGSSQESLTHTAANQSCVDDDQDDSVYMSQNGVQDSYNSHLPRSSAEDYHDSAVSIGVSSDHDSSSCPNTDVIDNIENIFEQIADAMLNEKNEISITLKIRPRISTVNQSNEDLTKRLSFPGKSAKEAWRFAVVIHILELMHEALRTDVVISKRDIYYRDPALFGSQTHVDRYVDDIAFTFGVTRTSLNVTAAAKGLVAGAIKFCRRDGSEFTAFDDQNGILVPALKDILSVDMSAVRWILVIEKEATFRSIAASSFWDSISAEGVIVTGKGYPDLASRALLHFLTTASPRNGYASPPVYGLADYDPDGVAILSTYKHGSQALAHEGELHSVPQLQWLGLHSEHLLLEGHNLQGAQGIMMLTSRDRRKAIKMIEQKQAESEWSAGLKQMLMLNMKAELQLLDTVPGGIFSVLETMRSKVDRLRSDTRDK